MKSRNLKKSEVTKILVNLPSIRDRCLFILGINTGFRISELLSLKLSDVWDGVDCKDAITVRRCNMKGKDSSRTIPLHTHAKQWLQEYLVQREYKEGLLFPISRIQAWRIIKSASQKAWIKGNISTHSMRKTFGMKVYHVTGNDIVAAQRALGHKSLASTSHYLSVDQERIDRAILAE